MNVDPTSRFISGVKAAVKPKKFGRPKIVRKKDEKEKATAKSKAKPKAEETEEPVSKKEGIENSKASQPMLPGMRGAVKRVKQETKRTEKPKTTSTSRPKAQQMMLPGMRKSSSSAKPKKVKEESFIPGGTDWSSVPSVNLDSPSKSRQFNGQKTKVWWSQV